MVWCAPNRGAPRRLTRSVRLGGAILRRPTAAALDQAILHHPEGREVVAVFVHGLTGHFRGSWGQLPELVFRVSDADALLLGYPSSLVRATPSVDELAQHLNTELALRCAGYERIVLIGHSLGGLVIQAAVLQELRAGHARQPPVARVGHVVLYAPPLLGSDVAGILRKLHVPLSEQARLLVTGNAWLVELQRAWVNAVYRPLIRPGEERYKRRIPMTVVIGLSDELVPPHHAQFVYDEPPRRASSRAATRR